jgi:Predicted membrane protein (DUF2306)
MNPLKSNWLLAFSLMVLCVVPVLAGIVRMSQLVSGVVTPENVRFFHSPLPFVIHGISVTMFCVLGAFQFVSSLRFKSRWHRTMGKLLLPFGLLAALSGLWMNQFYALPAHDGTVLYIERLVFGVAMFVSLVLGYLAIRARDYAAHRAWMMRGYAIGLGAGTQVVTTMPWVLLMGEPDLNERSILMGAGWVINVLIAEWFIRSGEPKLVFG